MGLRPQIMLAFCVLWGGCAADDRQQPAGVVTLIEYTRGCQNNDLPSYDVEMVESEDGVVRFAALSRQITPANPIADLFIVELHPERGFEWAPGLYDLSEVGSDINTCQICVLAFKNQDFAARSRESLLIAQSGLIEIQESTGPGHPFSAFFDGVELREVIAERVDEELRLNPVIGGTSWCGNGYRINAEIIPRPARLEEPIRDFAVQNCETGQWVSVYEKAENAAAVWFLGTTGWCAACKRYLFNGSRARGIDASPFEWSDRYANLELMVILGEATRGAQPTLEYCQRYAAIYRDRWARERPNVPMPDALTDARLFYLDHDGRSKFSALFNALSPYTETDGSFSLPWNAVVSGGADPRYKYVDTANASMLLSSMLTTLGAIEP